MEGNEGAEGIEETRAEDVKLTVKQQRFIEEYCKDFNATQAAIRSGYSESTAYIIGWENLRKPKIKELIDIRISALTMSADEALLKMSSFARGSFVPFLDLLDDGDVVVNLASLPAQENLHLIKKIKQTKSFYQGEHTGTTTEIEIHDSKDAVKTILQMHGKLIEKRTIDHTTRGEKIDTITVFKIPDNGRN